MLALSCPGRRAAKMFMAYDAPEGSLAPQERKVSREDNISLLRSFKGFFEVLIL